MDQHNKRADGPLSPWQVLDTRLVFDAAPWVAVHRKRVSVPGGETIDDFYFVDMPEHVVVVALTPGGGVVTVRQFRLAIGAVVTGLPAGVMEAGEAPNAAARRELLEETGYVSDDWTTLGAFVVSGNQGCGKVHVLRAGAARPAAEPRRDGREQLVPEVRAFQDVVNELLAGGAVTASTALALSLASLHEQRGERD